MVKSKSLKSKSLKSKSTAMHSKNRDKLEVSAERPAIDSVLQETRSFPPPVEFRKKEN